MRGRRGFTLVELLVVIAIIGVLASMLLPNAFKTIEKAKISKAEADLHSIKTAVIVYYTDVGTWPDDISKLMSDNATGWDGPYLEKDPGNDPWGGAYALTTTTPGNWNGTQYNDYVHAPSVPASAASKIDKDMDDDDTTTGTIQYRGTDLYYGVGAK